MMTYYEMKEIEKELKVIESIAEQMDRDFAWLDKSSRSTSNILFWHIADRWDDVEDIVIRAAGGKNADQYTTEDYFLVQDVAEQLRYFVENDIRENIPNDATIANTLAWAAIETVNFKAIAKVIVSVMGAKAPMLEVLAAYFALHPGQSQY